MKHVKIRKIGNSLGVVLSKEVLEHLNAKEGDTLSVSPAEDGVKLTLSDAESEKMLEAAEEIMERRFKVLRALSK